MNFNMMMNFFLRNALSYAENITSSRQCMSKHRSLCCWLEIENLTYQSAQTEKFRSLVRDFEGEKLPLLVQKSFVHS